MLSHLYRFHGHGSLRYLYRNGTSVRNQFFQMKYVSNPHRVHSRFAVVVSKKVYKSAVKRNRIRRRVYEVIRKELPLITPGTDMVITVFERKVLDMTFHELHQNIRDVLVKENLIS